MKTKINGVLTLLLAFMVQMTFAQERTISGVVSDEMGPVADISVKVVGTTRGTVTDFDGNYAIKAEIGDTLEFTHVSYATVKKVVGASSKIDVMVKESGESLEEVIVNAVGVKKKKINDLSSSTQIDVKVMEKSGESGLLQAMAGKTSGVSIIKNGGDPGAGSFIQIRGANSILNNDQPLVVLDGVLISNDNFGGRTDGVAAQSRLNDIPASDIKNVTILKGAQAAALYGSAAAAGVIVISTKSGKSSNDKKWKVNVSNSIQIEKIKAVWDLNTKFGQGFSGNFIEGLLVSYGDKISDRIGGDDDFVTGGEYFEAENGNLYYPIANKNSINNFEQTNKDAVLGNGLTNNYDVSLQYGGENGSTFISYSKWDQRGIVKNNSNYNRNTFRINNTTKYSKKLTGKISASYINSDTDLIQQGSNLQGLYLGFLRTPSDFDLRDYKGTYYAADGTPKQNAHRAYRNPLGASDGVYNNPLWTINEQQNTNRLDRFMITPEFTFKFNDNISLITRYNVDLYATKRNTFFPVNTAADLATGSYSKSSTSNNSQYAIAMLVGNGEFNDDIKYNWNVGANYERVRYESIGANVADFVNPFIQLSDLESIGSNFATQENQSVSNFIQETAKNGGFVSVDFDLYDQFLIGGTGRLEKSSTIDGTIFFPSASFGWKFSNLLKDNDYLNFGKIRLTYGEVATSPTPYNGSTPYVANQIGSSYGDALDGSVYGGLFNTSSSLGNDKLKYERVSEYEIGADFKLFKNLVNFGFTYYDRKTEDALVLQQLAPSSGYIESLTNNGLITNKGIEADLGIKILNSEDFKWNIRFNYSQNKNMVEKLPGGNVFLAGFTGSSAMAIEGEPMSVLVGGKFLRDADGNLDLDADGFPQLDSDGGDQVIGDPNADWRGGVNTEFKWKGFSISAALETSQGNDVWNGTKGVLQFFGRHDSTANEVTISAADAATMVNYNGQTVSSLSYAHLNDDGSYTVRGNVKDFGNGNVLLDQYWYTDLGGGFGPVAEQFVEDGSWVKLREITIGYDVNSKSLKKAGISNINVSVSGRNLYTWTNVEGFDPEGNLTGASKGRGLEYFTNPATKSYNFTVKIGF